MVATNSQTAHYRECRAPAKDLDGQEMCAASPLQVACSPGRVPAHKQKRGVRQPHPKEQSHTARETHDESLRAHAVRKSDLLSASDNESIGSLPHSWQQYHRHEDENHQQKTGAARAKNKHLTSCATAVHSVEERQPLQDLNGHVSRTVLRDGKAQEGCSDGQRESSEEYRARRVRQMHAANEELERRKAHPTPGHPQNTARGQHQAPKEVKKTHFQVPGIVGAQGAQPSTEALLRAVKAQQQNKQRAAHRGGPVRSTSVPKKEPASQAKKVVYTLHSPSMEADAAVKQQGKENTMQSDSTRPHSQPPSAHKPSGPVANTSSQHLRGRSTHREDDADTVNLTDQVPRKVAALARGFEARAGAASPSKLPDSGTNTPRRNSSTAGAQQTPSPVVNYQSYGTGAGQSYGTGAGSGRKLWPPFLVAPERKGSPRPSSAEPRQVEPEVDTASADPPRVIKALSFRDTAYEAFQHGAAETQHAGGVATVPQRPHTTPPQVPDPHARVNNEHSSKPVAPKTAPGHRDGVQPLLSAPLSRPGNDALVDSDGVPLRAAPSVEQALSRPQSALPPAIKDAAAKRAGLQHQTVTAFGSPFKQKEPQENVAMSMSCNVNMASPTADSPSHATSIEAHSKPPKEELKLPEPKIPRQKTPRTTPALEQPPSIAHAPQDPRRKARPAKNVDSAYIAGAGSSSAHPDQQEARDTDLRDASQQGGGSLLMQKVSDVASSPVDSIWRPLKKALTPQPATPHDHIEHQTLLAPDGSPADLAFEELEMTTVRQPQSTVTPFPISRHTSEAASEHSRRRTASSSRDLDLRGQISVESSRLQPVASRGALEASAAHMRDSSSFEEPFVDLLGNPVSSAYLKAGPTGGDGMQSKCCCSIM